MAGKVELAFAKQRFAGMTPALRTAADPQNRGRHLLGVHLEDRGSADAVRSIDEHLAIEATRT